MNAASELRDHLNTFDGHIRALGEHNPSIQTTGEEGRLQSASISRDDRKYYLDLKENDRGRFLRVCVNGQFSSSQSFLV